MAKQKKKRTKKYSGADAAVHRPSITRVSAVSRSKPKQWYYERKRVIKPVAIFVAVVVGLVALIIGFVTSIS